jgi:hypothetical protein
MKKTEDKERMKEKKQWGRKERNKEKDLCSVLDRREKMIIDYSGLCHFKHTSQLPWKITERCHMQSNCSSILSCAVRKIRYQLENKVSNI